MAEAAAARIGGVQAITAERSHDVVKSRAREDEFVQNWVKEYIKVRKRVTGWKEPIDKRAEGYCAWCPLAD